MPRIGENHMKHEWKTQERDLYLPKEKPVIVKVPEQKFFMINGKGNPNSEEFAERVGVLYSLSYAVKMMPKQGFTPEGYFEYTVYPLEGIWDLTEEGRKQAALNKDELMYTVMIRQPDFITDEVAKAAIETVKKKKPHPLLNDVIFKSAEDGLSVQILHIGPYDDEPRSFDMMKEFIKNNNLDILTLQHREIYLSDARKVEPAKLKTVLRYRVKTRE